MNRKKILTLDFIQPPFISMKIAQNRIGLLLMWPGGCLTVLEETYGSEEERSSNEVDEEEKKSQPAPGPARGLRSSNRISKSNNSTTISSGSPQEPSTAPTKSTGSKTTSKRDRGAKDCGVLGFREKTKATNKKAYGIKNLTILDSIIF